MGGTNVQAPTPRDYGAETRDTLRAQVDLAPELYASQAKYAPLYQDLDIQMLAKAAPQLMQIYGQDIMPVLSQIEADATRAQREADVAAVSDIGPDALAAMRRANPAQAELLDTMTEQATAGMRAGSRLTPDQSRDAQQSSRQAWAARGLAHSPGAGLDEILRTTLAGSGEQDRRRGFAGQVLGAQQAVYGDPFAQILGRPGQTFAAGQNFGAQAQGFNPGLLFNPESQYASDLIAGNQQQKLAAKTASAANSTALMGAGIQAAGSAAGSL